MDHAHVGPLSVYWINNIERISLLLYASNYVLAGPNPSQGQVPNMRNMLM